MAKPTADQRPASDRVKTKEIQLFIIIGVLTDFKRYRRAYKRMTIRHLFFLRSTLKTQFVKSRKMCTAKLRQVSEVFEFQITTAPDWAGSPDPSYTKLLLKSQLIS